MEFFLSPSSFLAFHTHRERKRLGLGANVSIEHIPLFDLFSVRNLIIICPLVVSSICSKIPYSSFVDNLFNPNWYKYSECVVVASFLFILSVSPGKGSFFLLFDDDNNFYWFQIALWELDLLGTWH